MHLRRFLFVLFAAFSLGPPIVFAQQSGPFSVTGTGCNATIAVNSSTATVGIQVTGSWSGTLQPKVSVQGQAATNTQVTPVGSTTAQSTITGNGVFTAGGAGMTTFLLCGNTVTGTAVIYLNASTGIAANMLGGGGGSTPTGVATGLAIADASPTPAPSPLGTDNPCVSGINPSMWFQKSDNSYYQLAGIDTTTTQPNATESEHGFFTLCSNLWYNDTGLPQFGKNGVVSIYHTAGNNTVDNVANDDFALVIRRDNPAGYSSHARQLGVYVETGLDGSITALGTCPDCGAAGGRFVLDDEHTSSGVNPGLIAALEGSFQQDGTGDWGTPLIGVIGQSSNNNGSTVSQTLVGVVGKVDSFNSAHGDQTYAVWSEGGNVANATQFNIGHFYSGFSASEGFTYNDYMNDSAESYYGTGHHIQADIVAVGGTALVYGNLSQAASFSTAQLPAPTFSNGNISPFTPGTTHYSYQIRAVDANGGGVCSAVGTTVVGASVLSGPNTNQLEFAEANSETVGPDHYDIYRTASSGTPSSVGKIGSVTYSTDHVNVETLVFNDTGLAGDSTTCPSNNSTGSADIYKLATLTNCASGATPAACGAASAGAVAIPAGATQTLVVDSTAVTASSQILLTVDESLTIPTTTCNTTIATLGQPVVTARTAGVSFTIEEPSTTTTHPVCVGYQIVN